MYLTSCIVMYMPLQFKIKTPIKIFAYFSLDSNSIKKIYTHSNKPQKLS